VPWSYIDRVGFTAFNQGPVGTGPLRFVSWTGGDRCVLASNPDSWDGRLDLDRVVVRPVPELGARVDALLRGEADMLTRLPPLLAERVAAHPATRVASTLYAGLYVLLVNVWVAPLYNPLVRQALSLAIDRTAIVRDLWRGRGPVPSGPIPHGDDHHDPGLPPLAHDPKGARQQPAAGRLPRRAGRAGDHRGLHPQRSAHDRDDRRDVGGRRRSTSSSRCSTTRSASASTDSRRSRGSRGRIRRR
jgi:peptide/nickel transport system substrate-binding protein